MVSPILADFQARGYARVEIKDSCNCCLPAVRRNRTAERRVSFAAYTVIKQPIRNNEDINLP